MKYLPIALFLFLAALAGCTSYTAKPIDPVAQQAALEARRLDSPGLEQYIGDSEDRAAWPPTVWDLPLLTLAALYYQPEIDRVRARSLAAEAGVVSAGGRLNPSTDVSFEHSRNPLENESPWTNGFTLQIPVQTAGKRGFRIDKAEANARGAQLREADALWQVRSRVRSTLLESYPLAAQLERQRNLQREITAVLERRFDAGYASRPELTRARLDLDRANLSLGEARKTHAEQLTRLAAAMGISASALANVELSYSSFQQLPAPETLPTVEVRSQALLNRPDLLAVLADYEASQSALQLEIAKQYPNLSIGPGYLWDQGQRKWTLGLSLTPPLLNRNRGPIAEARARREEAAATFAAAQAEAIAELDGALAGYRHATQVLRDADTLLRRQRQNEDAMDAAYRVGEADRLDWLSARYESATAELARTRALIEANRNLGQLEDALRRPLGRDAQVDPVALPPSK